MTAHLAPDPRNVRDSLLEAGYSPEEVEAMLLATQPRIQKATQRLIDAARSKLSEPFAIHGIGFAGQTRSCQECEAGPYDAAHAEGCTIQHALDVLGLVPIWNRAQLLEGTPNTGTPRLNPRSSAPRPQPTRVPPGGYVNPRH